MKQHISLREANQHLSHYIESAEKGEEIIITRRGKPIVKLIGLSASATLSASQKAAWKRIKNSASSLAIGRFDREELYHDRL